MKHSQRGQVVRQGKISEHIVYHIKAAERQ